MACLVLTGARTSTPPGDLEFRNILNPTIEPIDRMGSPQEVADAVLFLCSSKASFISGHALVCIQTTFEVVQS